MYTKLLSVLLGSLLTLSIVSLTTTGNAFAQAFDITTDQTSDVATITVQLAQPNETVIIPPNGSIIEVPATNITVIDNDTVIIVPENETVTELPGNVTVITPPEPEPCGCPPAAAANETAAESGIEDLIVRPAAGQSIQVYQGPVPEQNLTAFGPAAEPAPEPELPNGQQNVTDAPVPGTPTGNETITITPAENSTLIVEPAPEEPEPEPQPENNNDTGLTPAASFAKMLPWWESAS